MRHPAQIERWRRMSPAERFQAFLDLMEMNHRLWMSLPPTERERRSRILLEKHDRDEGHTARGAPSEYRTAGKDAPRP